MGDLQTQSPAPQGGTPGGEAATAARPQLPSVDEILRKRAAGIKLSRAEAGKLGGVNRRGMQAAGLPARAPAAPAGLGALPPGGPAPALVDPYAPAPLDPQAAADAVAAGLGCLEAGLQGYVLTTLTKSGADARTITAWMGRFQSQPDLKRAITTSGPPALSSMGVNPAHLPLFVFFGALGAQLGAWGLAGYGLHAELAAIRKEAAPAPDNATQQQAA
jgi:hypothetical protein